MLDIFIKNKSYVFETFKIWKSLVKNEKGLKIKVLRTDNELEFCNEPFNKYCSENGIARTVTYTTKQNGVAERLNKTLLDKVRTMLHQARLPKKFWGEAISTAAYLRNRTPPSSLDFKTPYELWFGKAPSYNHIRTFGCWTFPTRIRGSWNLSQLSLSLSVTNLD